MLAAISVLALACHPVEVVLAMLIFSARTHCQNKHMKHERGFVRQGLMSIAYLDLCGLLAAEHEHLTVLFETACSYLDVANPAG